MISLVRCLIINWSSENKAFVAGALTLKNLLSYSNVASGEDLARRGQEVVIRSS